MRSPRFIMTRNPKEALIAIKQRTPAIVADGVSQIAAERGGQVATTMIQRDEAGVRERPKNSPAEA